MRTYVLSDSTASVQCMKHCGRCQLEKPIAEFHRWGQGHQPWCKACKSEYAAEYYIRNHARRVEYNRRQRKEAVAFYRELKEGRPCADCGGMFHPSAMQWDHRPGVEKVDDVSRMYGLSRERVLEEIAKCDLVCANCHAVRTHDRNNGSPSPSLGDSRAYPQALAPVAQWTERLPSKQRVGGSSPPGGTLLPR